ncbi:hypothetical protein [Lysobacter sp. N42]|uniref:hypothetical protein n=1 Tax=Lysobacter sp. N42 TaxID=2545719 RepID=UPI00104AF59D|nr:hypothetical protein [Lysobacter sp. N42]TCZ80373.1 hypothetical protein EYQ95_24730 [Lysobacter sp. N42]
MKLCRDRQREILQILAERYPDLSGDVVREDAKEFDCANLLYLQEHGLVQSGVNRSLSGAYIFQGAAITARGLDFLADDGGLSAILGTVTVKLHTDTLKDLLRFRIEASSLPTEQKSWLRKKVDTLTDESLKAVAKSLVQQGLDNVPDLYRWLQTVLGAAP